MANQKSNFAAGITAACAIRKTFVAWCGAIFLVFCGVLVGSGWLRSNSASANAAGSAAPSAALAAGTETISSITKDGITWTFSGRVTAGQFVNGDYYVIGPVTVTAISPKPQTSSPYLNGSVKNLPTANRKSGFDSRLNDGTNESYWFDASVRSYPPITLKPGDSLVSSISLATPQSLPEVMRPTTKSASPISSMSVLTVLGSVPPSDAFRPSYCDRKETIYRAGDLRRNLLPSLAPANPSATPTIAQYEALYRRPWIDATPFLLDAPAAYMPSYGFHIAFANSYAGLLLMLNFPAAEKVNLTNYLVQYGIDLYGCVEAGYGWPAFGGHHSGRKMPIILAGILLNNSAMMEVSQTHPDQFGEDMQTLLIKSLPPAGHYQHAWQGATAIYGGHYGVHANGTPVSPGVYGPYEQLQPSSWPLLNGAQLGESYRRCCTSTSWVGEALAIHLLHGETAWNYPAFFDYVYRWMMEDDTQAIAEIKAQTGFNYSSNFERQGQTRYMLYGEASDPTFIDDMWHSYHW